MFHQMFDQKYHSQNQISTNVTDCGFQNQFQVNNNVFQSTMADNKFSSLPCQAINSSCHGQYQEYSTSGYYVNQQPQQQFYPENGFSSLQNQDFFQQQYSGNSRFPITQQSSNWENNVRTGSSMEMDCSSSRRGSMETDLWSNSRRGSGTRGSSGTVNWDKMVDSVFMEEIKIAQIPKCWNQFSSSH